MVESQRAAQVKDMIRQHLEAVGPKNWTSVRVHCPEISDATFWRYAKSIREELGIGLGPVPLVSQASKVLPQWSLPSLRRDKAATSGSLHFRFFGPTSPPE